MNIKLNCADKTTGLYTVGHMNKLVSGLITDCKRGRGTVVYDRHSNSVLIHLCIHPEIDAGFFDLLKKTLEMWSERAVVEGKPCPVTLGKLENGEERLLANAALDGACSDQNISFN